MENAEEPYVCKYCEKGFKRERTLAVHVCEQKRRHMSKDDKGVALGFHTYNKFYQHAQGDHMHKTYEEFAQSPYYTAFVKFGNYCLKTKCIKIERFIDWVVASGIKLDQWATDATYTKFLEKILKTENVNDALTRAIEYSIEWGEEKQMKPEDVLRYGSENRLCHAIVTGKLSPWVIYQSASGQEFLGKLNSEQMQIIWDVIDPDYWADVFEVKPSDTSYVQEMLKNAGW